MKINFSKKNLFLIVGSLIVISFFWTGYKSIQNEGLNEANDQETVEPKRSSTYPFNLLEGEVLSISEENIMKFKVDLSQVYPDGDFLDKRSFYKQHGRGY